MKRLLQLIVLGVIVGGVCADEPTANDPTLKDPLLKTAMENYQKRVDVANELLEKAKKRHADDVDAARKQLVVNYEDAIKRATRKGDLEVANALLAKKKEMEEGAEIAGVVIVPSGTIEGTLYYCGDDNYDLRINGAIIASGGREPANVATKIKVGDVIVVKVSNIQYEYGFMLFFQSKDKKRAFFTNTSTWKSYTPENPLKWWEVSAKTKTEKAAAGSKSYLKIKESAGYGADAIWGSSQSPCYLMHVVDRGDLAEEK